MSRNASLARTARLEALAAEHDRNPLHLTEMWIERSAIRQHEGGLSRAEADRAALQDVVDDLEGRR